MQPCLFCGGDVDAPTHREQHERAEKRFDRESARSARDHAIARVERHADDGFNDAALGAIVRVAQRDERFIVDAVWQELARTDAQLSTHERRAMGAVMLRAARENVIAPTEDFRASAQRHCHANPRRVWRSLIWRAA